MKRCTFLLCLLLVTIACDRPAVEPFEDSFTELFSAEFDSSIVREAPDFVLQTLNGDSLQLSSLRGHVVVLNFWATWCAPCLREMPALSSMHAALNKYGLTVVGVSMDTQETEIVRHFAERLNVTYPILMGDREVADNYDSMFVLPITYLIDEQGLIRRRFVGLFNIDTLQLQLDAYLTRNRS